MKPRRPSKKYNDADAKLAWRIGVKIATGMPVEPWEVEFRREYKKLHPGRGDAAAKLRSVPPGEPPPSEVAAVEVPPVTVTEVPPEVPPDPPPAAPPAAVASEEPPPQDVPPAIQVTFQPPEADGPPPPPQPTPEELKRLADEAKGKRFADGYCAWLHKEAIVPGFAIELFVRPAAERMGAQLGILQADPKYDKIIVVSAGAVTVAAKHLPKLGKKPDPDPAPPPPPSSSPPPPPSSPPPPAQLMPWDVEVAR